MTHFKLQIGLTLGALALLGASRVQAQAAGDAKTPDAKTPDAKTPDAKTPDAKTPDAKAPDAKAPQPLPAAGIAQDLEDGDLGIRATANIRQAYSRWLSVDSTADARTAAANLDKAAGIAAELRAAPKPGPKRTKALKSLQALTDKTTAAFVGITGDPKEKASSTIADAVAAANVNTTAAVTPTPPETTTPNSTDITFLNGSDLRYGPTVSLLRYQTSRRADEPGRLRDYTPALDLLPAQFGFQFIYRPSDTPWRLSLPSHKWYQLLSAGGMLLAHVDTSNTSRGSLSLAGTIGLFEDAIGVGVGFDLYRGIPVRGADGKSGSATVYTGLLAPAFAREGELTPENAFVVVTLNLAWLTKTVAGEL